MMKFVLCAAVIAVAVPAAAADTVTSAPAAKSERAKKVCRVHKETGSLIARRKVCKTAAEWRQDEADIQSISDNRACVGSSCSGSPE